MPMLIYVLNQLDIIIYSAIIFFNVRLFYDVWDLKFWIPHGKGQYWQTSDQMDGWEFAGYK